MPTGFIALEGGAEFGGAMAQPDRRCLELAGGDDARVAIVPTAAAADHNHERAGENGRRWFESLGARRVEVVPLVDRASAADPEIVQSLAEARLIYLLGGFPGYLAAALRDSPAWIAMRTAYEQGAVLAGSSAGAMVLCDQLYDPQRQDLTSGLGLLPGILFLPHFQQFGRTWVERLRALAPQVTLLGVDERTGMINDAPGGQWQVYGAGQVAVYAPGASTPRTFGPGQPFSVAMASPPPRI